MTDPEPQSEDQIFASAIEIPNANERSRFLDEACKGQPELRASLDELLVLHDTDAEFLDKPILGVVSYSDQLAGDLIGNKYRLIEQIGEGGFGVVWKANQTEPIQREVAVKIMKQRYKRSSHLDAERQSLAIMEHANIATVFDAGTTECGRAYFVMELVRGDSINKHCDDKRLTIEDRLKLFRDVCLAVHHAHQRGIIHRDIKPGNILVSTIDGGQVPKVIDFGIAKSMPRMDELELDPNNLDSTTLAVRSALEDTRTHRSHSLPGVLGTPEYMSPEQLASSNDIDTRADIYGLGGVLYQLLTSVSPRHGINRDLGWKQLHRALQETEPPLLSAQIKDVPDPSEVSENRSTTFPALSRRLRGDLELIVQKALATNRADRYSSASELADDIERYLHLQPTSVAPRSASYHFRKFVLRNKALTTAALLVVASLVLGTVFATIGFLQAEASRKLAEENGQRASRERAEALRQREQAMDFASTLEEMIGATDPERGFSVDISVRQVLDRIASTVGENDRFADSLDMKASLLRTIGRSYLTLRDLEQAEPHLLNALEIRQQLFGEKHPQLLESKVDYANYLFFKHEAEEAGVELDAILDTLYELEPGPLIVQALTLRSGVAATSRRRGQAAYYADEAWKLSIQVHGEDHSITLQQKARLAQYLIRSPNNAGIDDAEMMAREAYETMVKLHSDVDYDLAMAKWLFGGSMVYLGYYEEAETVVRESLALHRKLLGETSSFVVRDLVRLSFIRRNLGDREEARTLAKEAVALGEETTYDKEATLLRAYNALSRVAEPGSWEEADALGKQIEVVKILEGNPHRLPRLLWQHAWMLEELGQRKQATNRLKEAISILIEQDRPRAAERFESDLAELIRE